MEQDNLLISLKASGKPNMPKTRAKPKVVLKVIIGNDEWTCRLWRTKPYIKLYGDDSGAITSPNEFLIDFRDDELSLEVVAHELTHAYFKYLHLDSVIGLDVDNLEEIVASWLGKNHLRFTEMAQTLYSQLKGTA
jgi:hypothetical protein